MNEASVDSNLLVLGELVVGQLLLHLVQLIKVRGTLVNEYMSE